MTNDNSLYASSWQLPPTVRQLDTITRLCKELHISAPATALATRWQANKMIYELTQRRK